MDINECVDANPCGEGEVCVNRIGAAAECACAPGFVATEDGTCLSACGNGQRVIGEQCDDGNLEDDDGCSADCQVEHGWACFEVDGDRSECEFTCGDGFLDHHEECDWGEDDNSDTEPDACRSTCRAASCGDGVLDTGEECDDGLANSDLSAGACRTACVRAFCGDGVLDEGERCDPGGGPDVGEDACQGGCTPDAGPGGPDAGPAVDAGRGTPDGGAPDAGGMETSKSGGCGCAAPGRSGAPMGPAAFALAAAVAILRRRR